MFSPVGYAARVDMSGFAECEEIATAKFQAGGLFSFRSVYYQALLVLLTIHVMKTFRDMANR